METGFETTHTVNAMNYGVNPIFIEELYDEMYTLREKLGLLEEENNTLKKKLQDTQFLKLQLENTILMQSDSVDKKRSYKKRELSPEAKAFTRFYNETKDNVDVRKRVQEKMEKMGYANNYRHRIPYQLIKIECEMLFESLSSNEKQKYFS